MNRLMISGPDGVGKSTLCEELQKTYQKKGVEVEIVWLRFHHYLAKVVNAVGRITGKSYYETYSWGKVGYHSYTGIIGYPYIAAVYVDHLGFMLLSRNRVLNVKRAELLIIDRYIIDMMADLIVDTGRNDLVLRLFRPFAIKELEHSKAFVLTCDPNIVMSRRKDIADDKSYSRKVNAYRFLARELDIEVVDMGSHTICQSVDFMVEKLA